MRDRERKKKRNQESERQKEGKSVRKTCSNEILIWLLTVGSHIWYDIVIVSWTDITLAT